MKIFLFAAIERSNMKQKRPTCVKALALNEQEAKRLLSSTYVILGWMGQIVNKHYGDANASSPCRSKQ